MTKRLIRQLIAEHKTGIYKEMTLRQAYELMKMKYNGGIFNGAK